MGTIKVHGSPDCPQWWWNSQGFPPKIHRRGTQNLYYTRGGSSSPGQSWTTPSSRTTRGPLAGTPCRVNCHSYSLSPIASFPTKSPPFPEGKEVPTWDQSKHNQCWPGVCAYLEENDRVPKLWREFWCLLQCPSDSQIQRLACQQVAAFWQPTAQQKDGWWTAPPCLEVLGLMKYLPPKDFHGTHNYQEVRKEETIALAMALQRCAVQLGMPPGVLCGVVQQLCQCLAPLLEGGDLFNLEMLDIAKKYPVAPAPASASASPTPEPKEEEQITLQVPEEPCVSEPGKAANLAGELDLILGRFQSVPLGFACSHVNQTHTGLAWLDFCSLGSL